MLLTWANVSKLTNVEHSDKWIPTQPSFRCRVFDWSIRRFGKMQSKFHQMKWWRLFASITWFDSTIESQHMYIKLLQQFFSSSFASQFIREWETLLIGMSYTFTQKQNKWIRSQSIFVRIYFLFMRLSLNCHAYPCVTLQGNNQGCMHAVFIWFHLIYRHSGWICERLLFVWYISKAISCLMLCIIALDIRYSGKIISKIIQCVEHTSVIDRVLYCPFTIFVFRSLKRWLNT